jgi:hypothetical protein
VGELLEHPDFGTPLLLPGAITGSDVLTHDFRILNQTNREAMQRLSRAGLALPPREWRVNPDATFDWGLPEELFTDRTDVILTKDDVILRGVPEHHLDYERQVARVKVIGADRRRPNGLLAQIVGDATNDVGDAVDYFGAAFSRSQVIEDSGVDHADYAASYARFVADRGTGVDALTFTLDDWTVVGEFKVGDWIYLYDEEAGLVDPANPITHETRTVWPVKLRVVSRNWRLGGGAFSVKLRRADGTVMDIPSESVRWEDETAADVEVGDFLAEFTADPGGPATGDQFLAFRASAPR